MSRIGHVVSRLVVVVFAVGLSSLAGAAGPGSGGSGGKPPPGEEVGNNLAYPAMFYGAPMQTGTIGTYRLEAVFPTGMSYGCAKPETIGTTTYPNTSCVDDSASVVTPVSPEACVAPGGKCEGLPVERIYWQKNLGNQWQASYAASNAALVVDYVDWGDNLEVRSWPAQIIRVETNTFQWLVNPVLRFEVWHVFGQGTNELWGVHATNAADPVPYVFATWQHAVNVAPAARLNISKLVSGPATCPTEPGAPAPASPTWDPVTHWAGTWELYDGVYTPELNIKGSYVYGYNWNLRSAVVPPAVAKGGWWRLTFYTSNNSVDFGEWQSPADAGVNTLAPPASTVASSPMLPAVAAEEEEEESGSLYTPVVDAVNQLTYIDICVLSTKGGGKK